MSRMVVLLICGMSVAALVASGCQSNDIVVDQTLGAVVALVDSSSGLRTARTYALPDTVIHIPESSTAVSGSAAREITAEIRAHFLALGWTEVRGVTGPHPDVLLLVAASTQIRSGLAYSDWYGAWGYLPYWGAAVAPASSRRSRSRHISA